MASQKFFILGADDFAEEDGIIQARDKQNIGRVFEKLGRVFEKQGPSDMYFDCQLDGYWIISDEDYKLLRKKKNEK